MADICRTSYRDRRQPSGTAGAQQLAPIPLNLFNRGLISLLPSSCCVCCDPKDRAIILTPSSSSSGSDIFTNFGLYVYLTRDVARDRSRARLLFFNTSIMRLGLALLGVPLLLGFLGVRHAAVSPPLRSG
jgi:hypothetical protein